MSFTYSFTYYYSDFELYYQIEICYNTNTYRQYRPDIDIRHNFYSRNIITLPQGAIPIKINGLSALQLPPGASVKGLTPVNPGQTFNLTNLAAPCTNAATTILTSPPLPAGTTATAAKKSRVEGVKANLPQTPLPPNLIATASKVVTTNNNSVVKSDSLSSPRASGGLNNNSCSPQLSSKTVGNNKTCNWVFENGEICGKTFSKSYNLVVHMRMHEDVRPFCCSLCDQTFRQKAHLQVRLRLCNVFNRIQLERRDMLSKCY